jgi:uncharacterized protein (TIGR00369 family)
MTHWALGSIAGRLPLRPQLFAPHGVIHGGTLVAFADSLCGYGCMTSLPPGAESFATIDLTASLVGTARDGVLLGRAWQTHAGRTTQVWDAEVTNPAGKVLALFRCTQLVLWPR